MNDYKTQSKAAVARLSDTHWHRVQRARRWLLVGAELALCLGIAGGILAYVGASTVREIILTDAARMRAEAAEKREKLDLEECQRFPAWCRDRRSVFYQRPKAQPERQTTKRR